MKTKLSLLFFLLVIASSCSNKLSNSEAKKIISAEYPKYCKGQSKFEFDSNIWWHRPLIKSLKKLNSEGLMSYSVRSFKDFFGHHTVYNASMTKKASEKYNNSFAKTIFVEIIGISQTENKATVRYKVKSIETPFYSLKMDKKCKKGEWEEEVRLIKFDTGWKFEN